MVVGGYKVLETAALGEKERGTRTGPRIDPVIVTFSPTWFHHNYGVDYSEETWNDPIDRVERNREMARELFDRFGDVGIGSKDPDPNPNISDAYGNYFMPALFGCEIRYPSDQAPGNVPLEVSFEDMARLRVPDLDESPVIRRALAEAKALTKKYGFCGGSICTGSPINVAVNIYGEQFLAACAIEPAIAQHVLRTIAETEFELYHKVSAVIQPEAFPAENIPFGYGNCPAIMFSPRLYREVILPVDKWVRSRVGEFHLHHCGVFDAYIDIYKELTPNSLDIGGGSDYRAIREAFPDIPFSLIVNAPDIEGRATSEIDDHVGGMVEGASPVDKISQLWVAEVSERIEDEAVRAVRTANERI